MMSAYAIAWREAEIGGGGISGWRILQRSAKKAWLFAKLQPGRDRKRIHAT